MFDLLSDRQNEVVILVSQGLSNKEVAVKLEIREQTVKFHLTAIFKKLNLKSRSQLVVLSITHNRFPTEKELETEHE